MSAAPVEAAEPYNICELPYSEEAEAPLLLALIRDVAIAAAPLGFALWIDTWAQASSLSAAPVIGAIGAFLGMFLALLPVHEWGHYAGAKLTGAIAPRNPISKVFPMFHFDIERNTDAQFIATGLGGNISIRRAGPAIASTSYTRVAPAAARSSPARSAWIARCGPQLPRICICCRRTAPIGTWIYT